MKISTIAKWLTLCGLVLIGPTAAVQTVQTYQDLEDADKWSFLKQTIYFMPEANYNKPKLQSEAGYYDYQEWTLDQKLFVQKSLYLALKKLHDLDTRNCITATTAIFPQVEQTYKIFGYTLNLTAHQNPFQDLVDVSTTLTSNRYFLVEFPENEINTEKQIIAKAYFDSISVLKKQVGLNPLLTVSVDKSALEDYMENNDLLGFGAVLVHENLHHYGHLHPGGISEEDNYNKMFINVAERCIAQ